MTPRTVLVHSAQDTHSIIEDLWWLHAFKPVVIYTASADGQMPSNRECMQMVHAMVHANKRGSPVLFHNSDVPKDVKGLMAHEQHRLIRHSQGYNAIPQEIRHSFELELLAHEGGHARMAYFTVADRRPSDI